MGFLVHLGACHLELMSIDLATVSTNVTVHISHVIYFLLAKMEMMVGWEGVQDWRKSGGKGGGVLGEGGEPYRREPVRQIVRYRFSDWWVFSPGTPVCSPLSNVKVHSPALSKLLNSHSDNYRRINVLLYSKCK